MALYEHVLISRPDISPAQVESQIEELGQWLEENISDHKAEILEKPPLKIEVSGDMAYTCHREHATFKYQGKPNDDMAVWTTIYKREGDVWKVAHAHRSSGQNQ